ncbi:uncharacterized protein LOC111329712 isoform X2 [Stylophora pistillata]|uniref:uncharacterized protein LOC111329712 isoform X2 n=1 Tax=Stylophora pistillata TaxID=50429 RepID=UPI000C03F36B|nr:uncharacterized protein LOC111329712 isoform X2 [Stylophora pistillata]
MGFSCRLTFIFSVSSLLRIGLATSNMQNACSPGKTSLDLIYWEQKPYVFMDKERGEISGALPEILRIVFKACCQKTPNISAKPIEYPKSLKTTIDQYSEEIIIPVGRRVGLEKSIFLRPFVGSVDSPGMAVVVQRSIPGEELLAAILDSWPIMIFIGMSLSLSGIVMWVLDYRSNSEEFPEFFPKGVFEGVWWAAVTMTTVGYGDKVPRSIAGRLFGVVWINVGLVILAIFMGMITASLSSNSLEQVNNLYGMPVAVLNGSAEEQLAILQNAEVYVKTSYDELFKSVKSEETVLALVDIFSTTQHSEYYDTYKLYVATVLNEPVIYGAVLPKSSEALRSCFLSYQGNHLLEIHEILEKFIKAKQYGGDNSSSGADYFDGNLFGYAVYGMCGLFLLALAVGLFWQYYPREKKEQEIQNREEQDVSKLDKKTKVEANGHQKNTSSNCGEHTERLMAAQSAELLAMEDELKAFRKNWEKNFRALQERHKQEQQRLFELDNLGYEM